MMADDKVNALTKAKAAESETPVYSLEEYPLVSDRKGSKFAYHTVKEYMALTNDDLSKRRSLKEWLTLEDKAGSLSRFDWRELKSKIKGKGK